MGFFSGISGAIGSIFGGGSGGSSATTTNDTDIKVEPITNINIPLDELATALSNNTSKQINNNREIANATNKTLANIALLENQAEQDKTTSNFLIEQDKNLTQIYQNNKRNFQILAVILLSGAYIWKGKK